MTHSRPGTLRWVEFYGFLAVLFVAAAFVMYQLLKNAPMLVLPAGGGILAVIAMILGGTRLLLPLYFFTTFGTVLTVPGVPAALSVNRITAMLLFGAMIIEIPAVRHRLFVTPAVVLFTAFQLYYLPAAWALAPPEMAFPVESLFYILIAVVLALRYWQEKWLRSIFWSLLLVSTAAIVIPGVLEIVLRKNITLNGIGGDLDRVNGLSQNAIIYGFTAVWAVPLGATLMLEARSRFGRLLAFGCIAALTLMAVATLNRQTPIILAVALLGFVLLARSAYRMTILAGMVAVALVAAPVIGPKVIERFSTAGDYHKDPSLAVRRDKALIAREMLRTNLWMGIGHNHFQVLFKRYRPKGELYILPYVLDRKHFIDLGVVQIVTEYGVIGASIVLLMFLATIAMFWRAYWHSRRFPETWWTNLLAGIGALYIQLFMSLLIQDTLVTPRTYLLYGIFFAAYTGVELRRQALELERQAVA